MQSLGTWFNGGIEDVRLMVEFNWLDLERFLQPK